VEGEAERQFLRGIARKPGALRSMTKTLKLAHMLAAVARARPDITHLRDAYAQLGATDLTVAEAG
jgi:phage I-like protein